MKKKHAAGFVASLVALGVAIPTIDNLEKTATDVPNTLSLVGWWQPQTVRMSETTWPKGSH